MGAEEELQQAIEALEMAKARLENMSKEAELLQMSLNEHIRAIETLKAYSKAGEGKEILVPVGAGAFVPAKSSGQDRALVSIGAGLSVERKLDEAVSSLEKAASSVELEERKMIQEIRNLEKQAQLLSQRVQALSRGEPLPEQPEAPSSKKRSRRKDEEE